MSCYLSINYRNKCIDPAGWNLRGSDWGCCGNYDGCCTYASLLCYIHDALCRCCDVGDRNFCGPRCKPEVDCLAPSTPLCSPETDCLTTATTYPCQPEVDCSTTSGEDVDKVNIKHHRLVENVIEKQTSDVKNKQRPKNLENYKNAPEEYYKKIHSLPLASKTKYNSENGYQSDFVHEGSGDLEGQ